MRIKHLFGFVLLLSLCGPSFAQGLQILSGFRHDGPGRVLDSNATFALGMTRDNGATYTSSAGVFEAVEIRGEVRPEAAHIGQAVDIFVVDRVLATGQFRMRNQTGAWVPWNVMVSTLEPYRAGVTLSAAFPVDMFTGNLGITGEHRLFLGYRPADGILRYHTSGLPITLTAQSQSPGDQARALFASTISPNIIGVTCIACHVNGGSAQAVGAINIFRQPVAANVDANFEIFRNLVQVRGGAYVLSKVTGGSNHSGGVQLSASSAEYRSLETFVGLLAQ